MTPRMYSTADATESSGFRRRLAVIEAEGGITFGALLPFIIVKATVVRTSAFSSPPLFLQTMSSTGPKHQRFAKIIR